MMQELVGIVRTGDEMERALDGLEKLRQRAARASVPGNREYNNGWHTALDLPNLLIAAEAVARAGIERKESRGAHFRNDFPAKDEASSKFNIVIKRGADGRMEVSRTTIPEMPPELHQIIEEMR